MTIGLAIIFLAFSACDEKEKEILKRIEKNSKSIQSLRTDITLENFNAQLGETDIFRGKLVYIPKTVKATKGRIYLRIDWTKPVEESLAMIGKSVRLYRPRLNQVYEGNIENQKFSTSVNDALAIFNFSKEYLQANFKIKYLGKEKINNGVSTLHLAFTPKTIRNYKTIEIWADDDGILNKAKIILNNNDSTTVSLTNIEKNVKVNGDIFLLRYPKSVKVIRF